MTTAYTTHPRLTEHHLALHPEHAGRIRAVWRTLEDAGLTARMQTLDEISASDDQILAVHTPTYLQLLHKLSKLEETVRIDNDTYCTPTSVEVARLATGAVIAAADAVVSKQVNNALVVVRPPGHHAEPEMAMGFCLLGNIAIAARHAQKVHGVSKVLIVDYDVHHGNGTEAMFYDDPSVLFISAHQATTAFGTPFYPGTGDIRDIGTGKGIGANLNIPLPPGHGDASYAALFEKIVLPAARRFRPELILVSAGFDAHWLDPLAQTQLTLTGYAALTKMLIDLAGEVCDGRIVFVMEGGYHLDVLGNGIANIARLLLGDTEIADPLGSPPKSGQSDATDLIAQLCTIHKL
jgi:acetoin utilization deacetylase AcuC-like enzyme